MRILVIEDEELLRQLIQEVLDIPGNEVLVASNGDEALRHLASGHVDIVLSDMMMPCVDGVEAHQKARPGSYGSWTFMTSGCPPEHREYAARHGLPILAKPLSLPKLSQITGQAAA